MTETRQPAIDGNVSVPVVGMELAPAGPSQKAGGMKSLGGAASVRIS